LVPTLQYEDNLLYESIVVCEFLEEAYPKHGLKLLSEDPCTRARTRIWTDFVTTRIIPSFHRFLQFQPGEPAIDGVRSDFLENLEQFAEAVDETGPFFLGKAPSLVDFALVPWAVRLWVFDHYKGGIGIPEQGQGGAEEKSWSKWRKWLATIGSRRSIKQTTSEKEHYPPIYQR
jgi:glutathione S-transferase